MALFYGLITAISLGVGDFLAGQITKRVAAPAVVFYAQGFGAIGMLPIAWISGHTLNASAILWGLLAGVSLGIGFLLYFNALSSGKMGIVSSVTGILSAMIPVLTGLIIGENPGPWALVAILLIVIAVVPIAKNNTGEERSSTPNSKSLAQAMGAGMLIGLFFVFLHIPDTAASLWAVSFTMTGSFLSVAVVLQMTEAATRVDNDAWPYVIGTGILQTFATVTYVIGVNVGMMAIVALGGALSPLFTLLCARFFINERLGKHQVTGICLALTGIVILVLTT